MKHYIIGKFKPEISEKAALLPRIRAVFDHAPEIPGVRGAQVIPNCVDRENRYDVMIIVDMEKEALPAYDNSSMHHQWKAEFGPLLEKKAIFDQE